MYRVYIETWFGASSHSYADLIRSPEAKLQTKNSAEWEATHCQVILNMIYLSFITDSLFSKDFR